MELNLLSNNTETVPLIHKGLSLTKNKNNCYELIFESSKTYHYCTQGCNDSVVKKKCRCKDKDWWHDTWGGHLKTCYVLQEFPYIENIFNFLKDNYDLLLDFDRAELWSWFCKNKLNFISKYYYPLYNELTNYFENINYIFTDSFYETIKEIYISENQYLKEEEEDFSISYLSNKKNFDSYDDPFRKMEIYNLYKNLDEFNYFNETLNENVNDKFSEIESIHLIYESICENLESTLC